MPPSEGKKSIAKHYLPPLCVVYLCERERVLAGSVAHYCNHQLSNSWKRWRRTRIVYMELESLFLANVTSTTECNGPLNMPASNVTKCESLLNTIQCEKYAWQVSPTHAVILPIHRCNRMYLAERCAQHHEVLTCTGVAHTKKCMRDAGQRTKEAAHMRWE